LYLIFASALELTVMPYSEAETITLPVSSARTVTPSLVIARAVSDDSRAVFCVKSMSMT
jgi:hypothetical protein